MTQYYIQRISGEHNRRFLTTFGSFRYEAELQGGEKRVILDDYKKANKLSSDFNKKAYETASVLKEKLGTAGKNFIVSPDYYYVVATVSEGS